MVANVERKMSVLGRFDIQHLQIHLNHLCVQRSRLCKAMIADHININMNSSSCVLFLPPSLEWGLGDKACARLHTARSALRRSPSSGSRCPGLRLELLTLAVQSPGERSNHLLGVKRSPGVGMTTGPGAKPRHRRVEGTLGPLPVPTMPRDRQRRIRRLRCPTGKGQTHRRRHLGEKQRESPCEGGAQGRLCDCWIITN